MYSTREPLSVHARLRIFVANGDTDDNIRISTSDIQALSLTLAFFNLLPLPHLDGLIILQSLFHLLTLSSASPSRYIDLHSLESGTLTLSSQLALDSTPRSIVISLLVRPLHKLVMRFSRRGVDERRMMRAMERWTMGVGVTLVLSTIVVEVMRNRFQK